MILDNIYKKEYIKLYRGIIMVEFHPRYTEKSVRNHREYFPEMMKYIKEHPEEVNLYKIFSFYIYALGRSDSLAQEGGELLAKEPWYSYDLQYERAWRHNQFMSPNEYTEWLLQNFPQWKGIFYY